MRNQIISGLFLSLFLFSSTYAQSFDDACDKIGGFWQGGWNSPYAKCNAEVEAYIIKKNSDITMQIHLIPSSLDLCVEQKFVLHGTCIKDRIQVKYTGGSNLEGRINGQNISFDITDQDFWLNKKVS